MNPITYIKEADSLGIQLTITVGLILLHLIANRISDRMIKRYGKKHGISMPRVVYTKKYFRVISLLFFMILLGFTWDLSFQGLSVYFISFFTVAGVALFANWSILSNITASIILFFNFPYRIGDRIRIIDGDNSIEGIIFDLNVFSMIIKNDEGNKITYPNNLALQKAIVHMK